MLLVRVALLSCLACCDALRLLAPVGRAPATLPATRCGPILALAKKAATKKKSGKKKSAGGGFGGGSGGGGFGSGVAVVGKKLPSTGNKQLDAALAARCDAIRKSGKVAAPQVWLELGSLLVKAREYGEAERVFRAGAAAHPGHEMLSGAALTFGGDSAAYLAEPVAAEGVGGGGGGDVLDPTSDESFTSFAAPLDQLIAEDQADRAVVWGDAGSAALSSRGVVHRSNGPLIDPKECAWVIEQVEAHCATSGWSTARHVQAPTTDVPVSQVSAIRGWFDSVLREKLFPMLAARYPYAIGSADELRVMDAFVVRYDAREQASLPTHQDENTFSFTIALNDRSEYEGGGTAFEALRPADADPDASYEPRVLNADAGGVVTFPGKLRHGGNVVTRGRRYIIPLFIYSDRNGSGRKPGYVLDALGVKPAEGAVDSLSRYAQEVVSDRSEEVAADAPPAN
jgi:hypothetical protein